MAPTLTIALMGGIAVEVDGRRLREESLGPRGRVVFALLVLERRRLVTPDELAEAAWGYDLPPTWRSALRGVVSRLRRFLGASEMDGHVALLNRLGCYQLILPPSAHVDVEEAHLQYGTACRLYGAQAYAEAVAAAKVAARRSRGVFLPGGKGLWVEAQQSQLHDLHLDSLELLARAAIQCGEYAVASQAARELLAVQPYREPAYVLLMEALAASGNVSEAIRVYRRCCDVLDGELGSAPSSMTNAAYLKLLHEVPTPHEALAQATTTNLPSSFSTFVGRAEQLVALEGRLRSARLLTLTGTAGIGKSRLATEVAHNVASHFPDGIWYADLAAVATSCVAQHLRSVLKVPDAPGEDAVESTCRHIVGRRCLLILDNCEHLVSECAHLAASLLRASPTLTILATSREPFHVPGELVWDVPPLSFPLTEHDDPLSHEAVQLLVDRVHSVGLNSNLDIAAAAEICARLDGIPLAIELAAARARVFTLSELAKRLDQRLGLLAQSSHGVPARHRSLEAALDWSYQLLEPSESALFRGVAAFTGGFTLEAAEAVCGGDGIRVDAALCGLVDKSLVMPDREAPVGRFHQPETVRAYGSARLSESVDDAKVRNRHLEWACRFAQAAAVGLNGSSQGRALSALQEEQENLRSALKWALQSQQDSIGLQLAVAMAGFWEIRGHLTEGRLWLERFARRATADQSLQAAALDAGGVLAHDQCDYPSARSLHEDALKIRRSLGDRRGMAASLNGLANVAVSEGKLGTARSLFNEILRVGHQLQDKPIVAASAMNLAVVTQHAVEEGVESRDALHEARIRLEEAITLQRELGDLHGVALCLENLGVLFQLEGKRNSAQATFSDCLELYRSLGDKKGVAGTVRFLGQLCYCDGDLTNARTLLEECLTLEQELGSSERVAEALGFLGTIAEKAGDIGRARRLLEKSLGTYARGGNTIGADQVLRRLGKLECGCACI